MIRTASQILLTGLIFLGGLLSSARAEPSRHALIVGVKEYPISANLPNLTHTEADAELIGNTLKHQGYDVTLMTKTASEGPGNGRFNPTAAFIRKRFEALVKTPFLKKNDCVLVVLSGHGIQLPSRTDPSKKTFYFCPADADMDELKSSEEVGPQHNLIPVQELYDTLNQSAAGVKLLAVDACRNDPTQQIFKASNSATRPPIPKVPGGIAAFFSCSSGEKSIEDPKLKQGVFSYFFNEALTGKGDTNNDQQLTLAEIKEYVGKRVYQFVNTNYGRSQLPEMKDNTRGFAPLLTLPQNPAPTSPLTPMPKGDVKPPSPRPSSSTSIGLSLAHQRRLEAGLKKQIGTVFTRQMYSRLMLRLKKYRPDNKTDRDLLMITEYVASGNAGATAFVASLRRLAPSIVR